MVIDARRQYYYLTIKQEFGLYQCLYVVRSSGLDLDPCRKEGFDVDFSFGRCTYLSLRLSLIGGSIYKDRSMILYLSMSLYCLWLIPNTWLVSTESFRYG